MDQRIKILDLVYKELQVDILETKEKLHQHLSVNETLFFDEFQKIIATVFTPVYKEVMAYLSEKELTDYYEKVKELVILLSERITTKTKDLMNVPLIVHGATSQSTSQSRFQATAQATEGINLGTWTYLGSGKFRSERNAVLRELTKYVEHEGLTWKHHTYIHDNRGVVRNDTNYDSIRAGEVVYFSPQVISGHSIEGKLAELGYMDVARLDTSDVRSLQKEEKDMVRTTVGLSYRGKTFQLDAIDVIVGRKPRNDELIALGKSFGMDINKKGDLIKGMLERSDAMSFPPHGEGLHAKRGTIYMFNKKPNATALRGVKNNWNSVLIHELDHQYTYQIYGSEIFKSLIAEHERGGDFRPYNYGGVANVTILDKIKPYEEVYTNMNRFIKVYKEKNTIGTYEGQAEYVTHYALAKLNNRDRDSFKVIFNTKNYGTR